MTPGMIAVFLSLTFVSGPGVEPQVRWEPMPDIEHCFAAAATANKAAEKRILAGDVDGVYIAGCVQTWKPAPGKPS